MTAPSSPAELTGTYVEQVRKAAGLSRNQFIALLDGPHWNTQTRLGNIEKHESWKEGDREDLWPVVQRLAAGQLSADDVPTRGGRRKDDPPPANTSDGDARDDADKNELAAMDGQETLIVAYDPDWLDQPAPWDLVLVEDVDTVDPLLNGFSGEVVEAPSASFPKLDLEPVDHIFTNSELQSWRRCRRQWWLSWYRKLTTKGDDRTGARATGDRIHRALAAWYVPAGEQQTDPRDALERVIVEDWTRIAQLAQEQGMDELRLGALAAKFNDATTLERVMIEGYWQWLQETGADSELIIVGPEQVVVAYVDVGQHPDGVDTAGYDSGRRAAIIGKLDARMERRSDGVRLFDDHKTAKDLTSKRKTLHGDPQMLTYHVLEWLQSEEGEKYCQGALYTMLRKVKRTDRAKPPFFERVEVGHNPIELESWLHELTGAMRDIMRAEDELRAGANHLEVVYRTWRDECSWDCDHFDICPMFNDGSRVEDAVASLYTVGRPLERYDGAEVSAAVGDSVTPQEDEG